MTQSFRLDDLEEMWRLDSAPEPQPRVLSWFTIPDPLWEVARSREVSPGLWIVRIKKRLPVVVRMPSGYSLSTPDWHMQALCRGVDTALYFGDDQVGPNIEVKVHPSTLRQTKRGCFDCPVRRECLTWALDKGEEYGVWGGTSGQDRKELQERIKAGAKVLDLVAVIIG